MVFDRRSGTFSNEIFEEETGKIKYNQWYFAN